MAWDIVFVVIIVALAAWFMGRRLYRIVRNKGGCACDCDSVGKGACDGSRCPGAKELREITPKSKN